MRKRVWLIVFLLVFIVGAQAQIWRNPNAQVDARVADLLSKMTLDEKISQCSSDIPLLSVWEFLLICGIRKLCMECWHGSVLRFLKI